MYKRSTLYRRFWYVRRRNSKKLHIFICFISIVIILMFLMNYAANKLMPSLIDISDYKAGSIINLAVNSAVNNRFDNKIAYNDFVTLNMDNANHVTSIKTDVAKLNMLSSSISMDIQKKLLELSKEEVRIPAGALLQNPLLAGTGPDIHIKIIPVGNVQTDIKSEFSSAGINQTTHRLVLEVKSKVKVVFPLIKKESEVVNHVVLAETVIVGAVPEVYSGR